jgi:hypothetical protein
MTRNPRQRKSPRAATSRPDNTRAFAQAWAELTRESAESNRLMDVSDDALEAVERHRRDVLVPAVERAHRLATEMVAPFSKGPKAGLVVGGVLLLHGDHAEVVHWRGCIGVPLSAIEGLDEEGPR